jgi:hypothetical protein
MTTPTTPKNTKKTPIVLVSHKKSWKKINTDELSDIKVWDLSDEEIISESNT